MGTMTCMKTFKLADLKHQATSFEFSDEEDENSYPTMTALYVQERRFEAVSGTDAFVEVAE